MNRDQKYVFWGMAIQAFVVSFLLFIVPGYSVTWEQQAAVGVGFFFIMLYFAYRENHA